MLILPVIPKGCEEPPKPSRSKVVFAVYKNDLCFFNLIKDLVGRQIGTAGSFSMQFFVDQYDDMPPPQELGRGRAAYVVKSSIRRVRQRGRTDGGWVAQVSVYHLRRWQN